MVKDMDVLSFFIMVYFLYLQMNIYILQMIFFVVLNGLLR